MESLGRGQIVLRQGVSQRGRDDGGVRDDLPGRHIAFDGDLVARLPQCADGTEAAATDGGLADPAAYRAMRFEGGAHCWNGPPRSLTLAVRCGEETRLSGVTEPSRCEYEALLETPAACDAGSVLEAGEAAERALAAARGVGSEGKDLRDEL